MGKMDIEGAEPLALEGAETLLELSAPARHDNDITNPCLVIQHRGFA